MKELNQKRHNMYISDSNKARVKRLLKALKNPSSYIASAKPNGQGRCVELNEKDVKELIEALEVAGYNATREEM